MAAARRRHESALARDDGIAPVRAEDEFSGEFAKGGLDGAGRGIEAGDGGLGEELGAGGLGFAAEPVVKDVPWDGARAALGKLCRCERAALNVDVGSR